MIDPVSLAIQVAIVIGVNLIAMALSAKNVEQGKLDDINIDAASYGYALPRVFGCHFVTMQTIWIKDNKLTERRKKKKIGPFGIGGSVTTYKYSVTCVMAGGLGQAQMGRVWINNELSMDRRGNWVTGNTYYDGPNLDTSSFIPKGQSLDSKYWRWHNGSLTQQPPSSMVSAEGIENCSGHRGVFCMEFIDVPLEKYGNAIPTVKVEVFVVDSVGEFRGALYSFSGSDISPAATMDEFGRLWTRPDDNSITDVMDPVSNLILRHLDLSGQGFTFSTQQWAPAGGNRMLAICNGAPMYALVSYPYGQIARTGGSENSSLLFAGMPCCYAGIGTWTTKRSVVGVNGDARVWILQVDSGALERINYEALLEAFDPSVGVQFDASSFALTPFDVYVFWEAFASTEAYLLYISFGAIQWLVRASDLNGDPPGAGYPPTATAAFFNEHAGGIVFMSGESMACVLDPRSGNKLYDLPFTPRDTSHVRKQVPYLSQAQPQQGWFPALYNGSYGAVLYDFRTREVVDFRTGGNFPSNGYGYFPTTENALVTVGFGALGSYVVWYDLSTPAPVTVKSIVDRLMSLADIPSSYIDTDAATGTVTGFKIDRNTSLKAIEDLIILFDYELVDAGFNYVIRPRDETVVKAIDPDDLGAGEGDSDNTLIEYKVASSYDYPRRVELTFADFEGEYENNMVYAFVPDDTVKSTTVGHISTAVVLTVDEAKDLVYQAFSSTYRKRVTAGMKVPIHKYGQISVGDVVQLTDPENGDTQSWKVESLSGAYVLELGLSRSDALTNVLPQIGGTPRRTPEQQLQIISPTQVFIMDANQTRRDLTLNGNDDIFAPAGVGRFYLSYLWNGGTIYISADAGTTYEVAFSEDTELTIGFADKRLKIDATANVPDSLSTVTVAIPSNIDFEPQDASLDDLLEDPTLNIAKVQCGSSDNDWEIVQYGEVTDNLDGTYTFGILLRGMFGTEDAIAKHSGNSIFVFEPTTIPLPDQDPITQMFNASDIGLPFAIASISQGHTSEEINDLGNVTFIGRNVAPYSVSSLSASTEDDGDIYISWLRRDRKGTLTQSLNNTLPMSESVETYQVEIRQGDTVKRVVNVNAPEYTYSAADQSADGVDGDTITVRVYQTSAVVGNVRYAETSHAA